MTHRPNRKQCALGFLAVFLMASLTTTPAQADVYDHIDTLALRIQRTARKLMDETIHYRHTPEYRHLVMDTAEIVRLATHIHDVTHYEGHLLHLEADLVELDRHFHHLEGLFDRIEHNAAFGRGHVHGNTAHVKRLLKSIEGNIHHIQDDVSSLNRPRVIVGRSVYTPPVYPPAGFIQPGCSFPLNAAPVPAFHPLYGHSGWGHEYGHGNGRSVDNGRDGHRPPGHRGDGHRGDGHRGDGHRGHGDQGWGKGLSVGRGGSQIHIRF